MHRFAPSFTCAAALALAVTASSSDARADDTIKSPGDHPQYGVEVEPHLLFGYDNLYTAASFGIGGRFSIPIVQNGFVKTINNSVAISFGMDVMHYSGTCVGLSCSANYLFFPVAMQWNFYVAKQWSVFGEPGLFFYKGFFDNVCNGNAPCYAPSDVGVRPAFYAGGRYHFNDKVTLTMRIGYPTFSIGVSWLL